ncbi:MAG TPA: c-type cytochrome [bacterium]|jgi:thiosulfate dehydrogenase|nr:c-type cytochrome [bacterium]
MAKGFLLGILVVFITGLAGGYLFVVEGWMPANADGTPPALEKWMARTSLRATIQREASQTPNPMAVTDENLIAGIKIYAVNCAICHGASDGKSSNIAVGLYQHAPQLAMHGVTDDPDGNIYWKIKHGIRLTGMPAFGDSLSENQIWQLVLFLKNMDSLTPAASKVWNKIPSSVSPS